MTAGAQPNPVNTGGVSGSWDEPSIAVVNPDGVRGRIPQSQLQAAGAKGYRVSMYDANGTRGSVPVEQMAAATQKGYTVTPKTEMERQGESGFAARHPSATNFALNAAEGAQIPESAHPFAHPLQQLKEGTEAVAQIPSSFWQQHRADVATAENRFRQPGFGNKVVGAEEYLESGIPFLGSSVIRSQEQLERGDTSGGLGTAAGTLAPFVAPEAARVARENAPAVAARTADAARSAARKPMAVASKVAGEIGPQKAFGIGVPGEDLVGKGVVGGKTSAAAARARSATPIVARDIVEYHKQSPIKTVADLDAGIPEMQDKIATKEMNPVAQRHATEIPSADRMAQARNKALSRVTPLEEEFHPGEVEGARALIDQVLSKPRTIGDLIGKSASDKGGVLGMLNTMEDAYYAKYPSAKIKMLRGNPYPATIHAFTNALREQVMDHLESEGETGIRDARRRWGALNDLKAQTEKAASAANGGKPMSLYRFLGFLGGLHNPVLPALGEYAHYLNLPDTLVRRGVAKMAKNLPEDTRQEPQPSFFQPRALLNAENPVQRGPVAARASAGPRALPPSGGEMPPMSPSRRLPAVGETSPTRTARGVLTTPPLALPPMRGIFAPEGNPMAELGEPVPHYTPPPEPEPSPKAPTKGRSAKGILTNSGGMNLDRVTRPAGPSANDLKAKIAQLNQQERSLKSATLSARPGTNANQARYQKLRDISAKRADLQAQLEKIEPQAAKPQRSQEELSAAIRANFPRQNSRIGRDTMTHAQPRTPTVKESQTPTYDRQTDEIKRTIDAEIAAAKHWPQALREGWESDLAPYGGKGTSLREKMAQYYEANPPEQEREPGDQ